MPNWITNKVAAPESVLRSLVNEKGYIDFNQLIPFCGEFPWDGVNMAAEEAAEIATATPLDRHPLIASIQASNRASSDVSKFDDETFEQFVQMLRNKRASGYFHRMDFARAKWGTKWNACEQRIEDIGAGRVEFETAWSCPTPVLQTLSERHPEAEIRVRFADEDIGSNCGEFTLKAGKIIEQDIAPDWRSMNETAQAKWKAFAYDVKGWNPADYEDDE